MQLLLIRHGIAIERGTPGISDEDRPLTPEGEKKFRKAAQNAPPPFPTTITPVASGTSRASA